MTFFAADSSELNDLWSECEGGGDESVMELLFQMSSPEVRFFHEARYKEGKDVAVAAASKRPPTLEELIILSRRLSCARKSNSPVSPVSSLSLSLSFSLNLFELDSLSRSI